MRAVGQITICVAMEFTDIKTVLYIVVSGSRDKCMVKAKKLGLRVHSIMATMRRERNRVPVLIYGSTVLDTMASGITMKSMETVQYLGRMADVIQVNGKKEICMVMESTFGATKDSSKDNIMMIKNMGMVSMNGPMDASTKDIGKMVNSTAWLSTSPLKRWYRVIVKKGSFVMEYGKTDVD